jgi:hypothetical protein
MDLLFVSPVLTAWSGLTGIAFRQQQDAGASLQDNLHVSAPLRFNKHM